MAFKGYTVDESITRTDAGVTRVPEGDYLLAVSGQAPSAADYDGDPYFRWELQIVQGPGSIGRRVQHTTTMMADSQFGLGRLLLLCGIDPSSLAGHSFNDYARHKALGDGLLAKIKGRQIGAYIADKAGTSRRGQQQKMYSNIIEVYPAEEYEQRASSPPRPASTPALPDGAAGVVVPAAPSANEQALTEEIRQLLGT